MRRLLSFLLLMIPVVVGAQGQTAVVRSVRDIDTHNLGRDLTTLVAWSASLPPAAPTQQRLTRGQAIANARAFLEKGTRPEQTNAMRSDPSASSARSLQGLAAAAVGEGKPIAALAALLLAEERYPRDRMVLINLAGTRSR